MSRKFVVLFSFLALAASPALAQIVAPPQADPETIKLLQLMDKDRNGKVSRDEFMAFMSAEFDRLDVNKDGALDVKELQSLRVGFKHTGGSGSK